MGRPGVVCCGHMAQRCRPVVALGVVLAALGCDGDVQDAPDGGAPIAPSLRLLVPGNAKLVSGQPDRACARPVPDGAGAGQRWCAFHRPSAADPARTELWVLDVARAMSGAGVPCDGTSAACLRLTDRLFTGFRIESPSHPEGHRFEGDTLFFLADEYPSPTKLERYEGFVWAWRPGWQKARPLTSERGVLCRGSDSAPVAVCVDSATDRPPSFELRAGRVVDGDDSLLPVIERITPLRAGELVWSAGFAPGGDLAYSSWREGDLAETLRVIRLADLDPGRPRTSAAIIVDGWGWTLSPRGDAVYFLRERSPRTGAGTLWAADFPSGENATMIAAGVSDFAALGAGGTLFLTDVRGLEGLLNIVPDRRRPEGRMPLAPDAHAWYPLADDRFTYILQSDRNGERGLLADNQRVATCSLASRDDVTVFSAAMVPELGVVSWTEPDPAGGPLDLRFVGRPEDCGAKQPLGAGIEVIQAAGARGVVLGFRTDPDRRALSFQHVPVLGEGAGQTIMTDVDPDNLGRTRGSPDFILMGAADVAGEHPGVFGYGPLGR